MNSRIVALSTALLLAAAAPAAASSLPRADFSGSSPNIGIGAGFGNLSGAFDLPLSREWQIGLGVSSLFGAGANADLRVLYRFWNAGANPFTLALLAGVQADGGAFNALGNIEPIAGLAAAYPITSQLVIRANAVAGVMNRSLLRPAGVEVGYRFHPNMEFTVGANGRGDYVGVNLNF